MSYVAYHKETTILLKGKSSYKTKAAARAAITRAYSDGKIADPLKYDVAEAGEFATSIEKQVEKVNMMSGKKFWQPVNTPISCDPSSETYWSM